MTSHRHKTRKDGLDRLDQPGQRDQPGPDDTLLDAARASLLAVGWRRSTLTDVARRAGVSRMTIYRRWPDMQTLLADLMTREWSGLGAGQGLVDRLQGEGTPLSRIAEGVAATVTALRDNELFAKIVQVDPELLLPYLLDRRGRTQDALLALLETTIVQGQHDSEIRPGDPVLLARSVLLTTHGFVLSAATMADGTNGPSLADLDGELRLLVQRYLAA